MLRAFLFWLLWLLCEQSRLFHAQPVLMQQLFAVAAASFRWCSIFHRAGPSTASIRAYFKSAPSLRTASTIETADKADLCWCSQCKCRKFQDAFAAAAMGIRWRNRIPIADIQQGLSILNLTALSQRPSRTVATRRLPLFTKILAMANSGNSLRNRFIK